MARAPAKTAEEKLGDAIVSQLRERGEANVLELRAWLGGDEDPSTIYRVAASDARIVAMPGGVLTRFAMRS
jgi:3-methyladenine DNA glycosylase Mpg